MANAPKDGNLEEGMRIVGEHVVIVKRIMPRASKSGKSMLLASSNGAEVFTHEGREIKVNLNVYTLNT